MIIKFFDKLHYKLSLSEEHINDIIKSNSKYGADIKSSRQFTCSRREGTGQQFQ